MSVRRNLLANYAGQAWASLMGFAFVPIYIGYIGIEAYGIIGFFAAIQSALAIFDLGASATLNRQLAHHSANHTLVEARDLVRTLEWFCWPTAALTAVIVWAIAGPAAEYWLSAESMAPARAEHALVLLGLAMALQWPSSLYVGGLAGLQRQVLLNALSAGLATVRSVGAIAVLAFVAPTLEAFLWWQVASAAAQSACFFVALWAALPRAERRPAFSLAVLRRVARFAIGVTGVAVVSFLLTSTDRIVLAKVLPLHEFGVYAFAATAAFALFRVVQPIVTAVYPRYSQLVASGDLGLLHGFYHRTNQLVAVTVLPIAAVAGLFAPEIFLFWTRDAALAAAAAPIFSLLIAGSALNALANLPYVMQLAHGWTSLSFWINLVAVCVLVPGMWLLGSRYGALGAALLWPLLNLAYLVVQVPLMHRRILRGEMWRWYGVDVVPPLVAALAVAFGWRAFFPVLPQGLAGIALLVVVAATTAGACALVSPLTRNRMRAS